MGLQRSSYYIQIKIKMLNPSQEPPASSKAPEEDLKNMDVLCTFKINPLFTGGGKIYLPYF